MEQEANGQRVSGGGDDSGEAPELTVEIVDSLSAVDADEWDRLLGAGQEASPFLEHRFLLSLEEAGTLGQENGWIPRIPIVRRDGRLVAAAPAYVKLHSQGEFVFDWSWADVAQRVGLQYYPKLLLGVPFTPVTGRRLLTAEGEDRAVLMSVLGQLMIELCEHMGLSSVHVNFAMPDEVQVLEALGYAPREGIQYHWNRREDACFDDYLGRFKSKQRNQLKRECRAPSQQGITIETRTGDQLNTALMDEAFRIYKSTIDKFYWGRQYLNRDVFELWMERMPERLEVVTAVTPEGETVAGAINFAKNQRLYGRYWGCFADVKHLHFNVCYYHGVKRCLENGWEAFEPGAGGQHKLTRHFEPTIMRSAHWIHHDGMREIISRHLIAERMEIRQHRARMMEELGLPV